MKKLLLIICVLAAVIAHSQPSTYFPRNVSEYVIRSAATSTFHIPGGAAPTLNSGWVKSGAMYVDTVGGGQGLWVYVLGTWKHYTDSTMVATMMASATVDTFTVSTRAWRQKGIDSLEALIGTGGTDTLPIMGDVVSTTFTAVTGFTQTTGTGTFSYGAGGLTISGGDGTRQSNKVVSDYISMSNNYRYIAEFTVNTKPATHLEGLDIAKFGTTPNISMYFTFKMSDASHARLTMRVVNGAGNGTIFDSTATVAMANGNVYRITGTQSSNGIYFRLALLTAGVETEVVDKLFNIPPNTAYQIPSIGSVGVGVLGGNYTVSLLKQTNYDVVGARILAIGTSITQGHYPTSFNQHYLQQAFNNTGVTYNNFGQGGSQLGYVLPAKAEIFASDPDYVLLEEGVNDACGDIRTYAVPLIDTLQAHGITVIWLKDFTNTCKDSVIFNICKEQGVQLIDPGKTMTADMFQDLVHPTDIGFTYMARFLRNNLPNIIKRTGNVDQYTMSSLKDVLINGAVTGDLLAYNSTTTQWNNVSPSASTSFIRNQFIGAQTADAWISGSFRANAEVGFGGAPVSTAPVSVYDNASGGQGIRLYNNQTTASSGIGYSQVTLLGSTASGIASLQNTFLFQSYGNGGTSIGSYQSGGIKFLLGSSYAEKAGFNQGGQLGIGVLNASVTANIHIKAGTATANTGPLKFTTSGAALLTTPEAGTMEVLVDSLFYTGNSGTRYKVYPQAGGTGTVTSVAAGTGMNFTTITATGTVNADTLTLSTRAWRDKLKDSLIAIITASVGTSGTYTPTLTNTTNLDGSTASVCHYLRVGNEVTVAGSVAINPTATGAIALQISLPIASTFTGATDVGGTAICPGVGGQGAGIRGNSTTAELAGIVSDTNNATWQFHFTYIIK